MNKLLLTLAAAFIISCKKESTEDAQPLTFDKLRAEEVDCRNCMQYVGSKIHHIIVMDKAEFCKKYCESVKRFNKLKW